MWCFDTITGFFFLQTPKEKAYPSTTTKNSKKIMVIRLRVHAMHGPNALTCAFHITMPGMDVRHMHVSMHVLFKVFHKFSCHDQLKVMKVQVLLMRLDERIKRSSLRCSSFT
jgi:hypothetical protein